MFKRTGIFAAAMMLGMALAPSWSASAPSSPADDEDMPFKPYWENEIGLGTANQQGGQSTNTLSYTGTQHFTEGGNFLSAEVALSKQKVEGVFSNTGTLTTEGGLGLGFFSPSLSLGYEVGDSVWRQGDANLTLGFQLWDPLALNLTLGGNAGSHQGDISTFYPSLAGQARIDTASWDTTLGPTFTLWDWWSLSLTLGYQYDTTYQLQGIKHPEVKVPVNQSDRIASLTLGLDFTLFKGFILDLSPEAGQEYQPAGAVYSPLAGGLVANSAPTTHNFVGGALSVSYSFE